MSSSQSLLTTLLVLPLLGCEGAVSYKTVESLPVDSNGRLAEHFLIFASPEVTLGGCQHEPESTWRSIDKSERSMALASDELASYLGFEQGRASSCGVAFCLERGSSLDHINHWNKKFTPTSSDRFNMRDFNKWYTSECQAAEIGFVSYNPNPIQMFWVDPNTQEKIDQGEILYGERNTAWRTSYLGHVFQLEDKVTKQPVGKGIYKVEYNSFYNIGYNDPPDVSEEEAAKQENNIEKTLIMEYDRSRIVKRVFTKTGFDKAKLSDMDPYVWGSIQAYYYNNKNNGETREEWHGKGVYVNWWEVEPIILQMPWQLKTMWHNRLRLLVQEWIGGVSLENTDIYGMRTYQKGARLLSHVDRSETHAASMIVNIDQSPNTSWPVEIYDHADHLYEVEMAPGDLVFYESAKCLHARMKPLPGDRYTNMFVHYRPTGDEQWFKRSNPPGSAIPVTEQDHSAQLGASSQISNDALGGSVRLTSGGDKIHTEAMKDYHDLYDYWVNSASMSSCDSTTTV